eukprot:8892267-Prorocentrum_lima.AAC.1
MGFIDMYLMCYNTAVLVCWATALAQLAYHFDYEVSVAFARAVPHLQVWCSHVKSGAVGRRVEIDRGNSLPSMRTKAVLLPSPRMPTAAWWLRCRT